MPKDAKNAPRDVRVSIKEQSQMQCEGLILRQFFSFGIVSGHVCCRQGFCLLTDVKNV